MTGPIHIAPRSPRRRIRLRVATVRGRSLTVNVSAGGFCTGVMRVLPVGSQVEGRIDVDGRDMPFAGTVVWARPGDPRMNLMGKMGVRFLKIDPEAARGLAGDDAPASAANDSEEAASGAAS
jgi:hypothetical protein